MTDLINMIGVRAGARTVVSYVGHKKWLTKCDCGVETIVAGADIRRGRIKTCSHKTGDFIRFFQKVKRTDSCWIWMACKDQDGYGSFKKIRAHQWSYIFHKGKIPNGLEIDHLCRNRDCVNPDHLEAITHIENVHRGNMPSIVKARGYLVY